MHCFVNSFTESQSSFKQYNSVYSTIELPLQPDILNVSSLKELVYAAGGYIENGMVIAPGRLASVALSACAALCGDRSVARGSTHEYFNITYRRFTATSPELLQLAAAGIIRIEDSRVILMPAWRTVWRLAQIFADKAIPMTAMEVYMEYTNRFEPVFPGADTGEFYTIYCKLAFTHVLRDKST